MPSPVGRPGARTLLAVLDGARAALALVDPDGGLVHANPAFTRAWPAGRSLAPGARVGDLLAPGPGTERLPAPTRSRRPGTFRGSRLTGTTTPVADGLFLLQLHAGPDPLDGLTDVPAAQRAADLRAVVLALSEALTVGQVTAVMTGLIGAALGSAGVLIALLDDDGVLQPLDVAGYGEQMRSLISSRLRDPDGAPMAALTERRPTVYPSPADYLARFPGRADLVRESKMQSWVYLPLIASGRVIGTWTVSYAEQHATTPPELALLVTLAALCAQSLERARLYEQAARTSGVLQRAIAPRALPALPGVLLAARYVPATAGDLVGGDFYDVRPLPDGRVLVLLGDVSGHDIAAAALMGQVLAVLRAYAAQDRGPADLLASTNRLLGELTHRLVTCCCLELELATGRGRLALAGHPPPVVVRWAAGAQLLDAQGALPLAASPDTRYPEVALQLAPGDLLLLYSDGLVESRELPLDEGLARLVAAAAAAPRAPQPLVDHVVEALRPVRRLDDLAVLALQRLPA